jgi:hypothetical protein
MVASKLTARGVLYRGTLQFLGVAQDRPTHLFTDNDGTWYVARDAASTTSMTYIIRHVRFIQQAEFDAAIKCFQIDGELNPPDVLTKYKSSGDFKRHMAFMMGFPEVALKIWQTSPKFLKHKAKRIMPVPNM